MLFVITIQSVMSVHVHNINIAKRNTEEWFFRFLNILVLIVEKFLVLLIIILIFLFKIYKCV